jgi:hypothetical protein
LNFGYLSNKGGNVRAGIFENVSKPRCHFLPLAAQAKMSFDWITVYMRVERGLLTFSRQSWPMALGSTRTSKTTELGWLMRHHIFFFKSKQFLQYQIQYGLDEKSLAKTTDHLTKSQCPIILTAYRLLYKLLAHFTTTSILCNSLDNIKSKFLVQLYFIRLRHTWYGRTRNANAPDRSAHVYSYLECLRTELGQTSNSCEVSKCT